MKKLFIIALTTIVAAAFAIPASAVEHEFGGYWRTRAYTVDNWAGNDTGSTAIVDTRTRLYYTAKFSEDFKFVNKFEFNNIWGDDVGGDIGTDGMGIFRVKHSYVDFNTAGINMKIGLQGSVFARGLLFDDDYAGAVASYKMGNNTIAATWMKVDDEAAEIAPYYSIDAETGDIVEEPGTPSPERDHYAISANISPSDTISVAPFLFIDKQEGTETTVYYLGGDVDVKAGPASVWGSLIYEAGEIAGVDKSAFLVAAGVDAGIPHAQVFYATGDDGSDADENNAFTGPAGQCYYWAEIMGFGVFDNDAGFGSSPNGTISNVLALNLGATVKPMDKLTVSADVWYATLNEDYVNPKDATDPANGETDLGIEIDLKATYGVLDNLNLDLVAAYLISGDAVAGSDSEDVMEYGARLSMSF